MLATSELHRPLRCPLPDQLTPAHVQALLSDLRLSASQVTVCVCVWQGKQHRAAASHKATAGA